MKPLDAVLLETFAVPKARPIRSGALFIILLLFLATPLQAATPEELIEEAERLGLAGHPTWLQLLHYEKGDRQSAVLADEFFLSPEGRTDPKAELAATIRGYFGPWGKNGEEHPRCRFPARYFWLSQHLPLPDYNLREPACAKFERLALLDSVQSVSLLLVSGYFGNPASTFGHALLKLNTDSDNDLHDLFDLTLNYGAMVPENEPVWRYVVRGLFGGYQAGFSDRYFYTQDLVYSRTEFRDIWDYRLNLSDEQRILLILHIWEITGKKFNYYFLEKNCAYRLAELVDIVLEEDLVRNSHPWYIPVEMFHRLKEIDRARRRRGESGLIQSVRYIPSSQRALYHQLQLLLPAELEAFSAIVQAGVETMPTHLEKLTPDQRISVLDSLLAYQQYRLIAEGSEPGSGSAQEAIKDRILRARLWLPPRPAAEPKIPELRSPADGSKPMELGAGMAAHSGDDFFFLLNWSPFKKETVGQNSLEGDELVVLDLSIGVSDGKNKVFLDELDLVRVLKLSTIPVQVVAEEQWSWALRLGVDRLRENERNRYDGVFSFGAGRAKQWNKTITTYGLVAAAAHTLDPFVRLRPHLGLKLDLGKVQAWGYLGAETTDYRPNLRDVWGGKLQYQLNDRYSFRVEVTNEKATRVSAGINRYF